MPADPGDSRRGSLRFDSFEIDLEGATATASNSLRGCVLLEQSLGASLLGGDGTVIRLIPADKTVGSSQLLTLEGAPVEVSSGEDGAYQVPVVCTEVDATAMEHQ